MSAEIESFDDRQESREYGHCLNSPADVNICLCNYEVSVFTRISRHAPGCIPRPLVESSDFARRERIKQCSRGHRPNDYGLECVQRLQ